MSAVIRDIEWEGDRTVLYTLNSVRESTRFPQGTHSSGTYRQVTGRRIESIYVHQTAGGFHDGIKAVDRLADFFCSPPKFRIESDSSIAMKGGKARQIGGGRGWPGIPYTFVISTRPDVISGKFSIYRIWDDSWRTWHTQAGYANDYGVAIAMVGYFKTRHDRNGPGRDAPDVTAMVALEELTKDYLLPRYSITATNGLKGHFDAGKPACPGDYLENWVRRTRGERVGAPGDLVLFSGPLDSALSRQERLASLGYDVGALDGMWGPRSRRALEAFQDDYDLLVDGIWGPKTELMIRSV